MIWYSESIVATRVYEASRPDSKSKLAAKAQTLTIIYGRLREKMEAKIAANTIGTVVGWENKLVQVRVSVMVNDKSKNIDHGFKVDLLEPQKDASILCSRNGCSYFA